MKLFHRLQAWRLRRKLVRQRAQNIADLRAGRAIARDLAARLAREKRLSRFSEPASAKPTRPAMTSKPSGQGSDSGQGKIGRIPAILAQMPKMERRAA